MTKPTVFIDGPAHTFGPLLKDDHAVSIWLELSRRIENSIYNKLKDHELELYEVLTKRLAATASITGGLVNKPDEAQPPA